MTGRRTLGERYRGFWHRAGLLWNRVVGTFLVVIGGWAVLLSFGSDNFSIRTHWPTFVAVGGLWWLARWFFKARDIVIEPVDGEGHPGKETYPLEALDRRIGTLVARTAGTIAVIGGTAALWSVVTLDDFTIAEYWPVLAMAALLLLIGWACFRGRPSFLNLMSEVPLSPAEEAARVRQRATEDANGR